MQENEQTNVDREMYHKMEEMVDTYDSFMNDICQGNEKALREMTINLSKIKAGDCVLEIGCGTGTLSLAAKQKAGLAGKVFGIDMIPGMIENSKRKASLEKADVTFQLGNITDIPFPDNHADVVMCSFMIYHMSENTRIKGFSEIYRVLKPAGHLFIIDTDSLEELPSVLKINSFTEITVEKTEFLSIGIWYLSAKAEKGF